MENITIGQIVQTIGSITAIAVFFIAIYKWYKSHIIDEFSKLKYRVTVLEEKQTNSEKEMQESKEERLILLRGQLACLRGLHNDLHCNGPVTQGINELEEYLIKKSHE